MKKQKTIYSIIPNPEDLLSLEPEELAGVILEYLNSLDEKGANIQLNRYNFSVSGVVDEYPREYRDDINKALMEAWVWLEREGYLAPRPGQGGDWCFITRRGKRIRDKTGLEKYRKANLLPRQLLHPVIAEKIWAMFIRGEYDTAVFQSFKEIEVVVRDACGYSPTELGVSLMRKAFHPESGPLTDTNQPMSEREALQHLFAGCIGSYKNPHSHRNVTITDPVEAVEIIMIASHLLRIVDLRVTNSDAATVGT